MYKYFFHFDLDNLVHLKAYQEIQGYKERFRAEYIRHCLLASSMLYADLNYEEVIALAGVDVPSMKQKIRSEKNNCQHVTLRWPQGQSSTSRLDAVCKKAETVNTLFRSVYLLSLFLLGQELLAGVKPLQQNLAPNVSNVMPAKNDVPEKATSPKVDAEVTATAPSMPVPTQSIKPKKANLKALMKRS